jgi:hypothetical protein
LIAQKGTVLSDAIRPCKLLKIKGLDRSKRCAHKNQPTGTRDDQQA